MFFLVIFLFIAQEILSALSKPKGTKPTAGSLGDFNFPTASEGRAVPYFAGTVEVGGGNSVWWGDLKVTPIKKRPSLMSFTSQIVGFKYALGIQYALGLGPVDELVGIVCNGKAVPYTATTVFNGNGTEDKIVLDIDAENLFGGTGVGGEGGLKGKIDFYRGLDTQQPNDYLTRVQGRIAADLSGLGYAYAGTGNGVISFLSGGADARTEEITATATTPASGFMRFAVRGSISGFIGTATADTAFSSYRINITIETGSTAFVTGDKFTIQSKHATQSPAYKGLCQMIWRQVYTGITPNPKPIKVRLRKCVDPFAQGAGVANIGGDANGILVIYDLMTNDFFGLGFLPAKFDIPAFMAAAVVIADEGLGISFQQDSVQTADSIIGEILRHLDGVIYTDPSSGLWTVKLARDDYDADTIPMLDADAIEKFDFARGSWGETTNYVVVTYLSRAANFNDRTVLSYDPANIAICGEVRAENMDFKYISDRLTASVISMRALRTMTYPLAKVKIICNRKAWNYRMGQVFKVNWPELGIVGMIVRISHINYGELRNGKITIDAVEDIFGLDDVAFVSPPESGWVDPFGPPIAAAHEQLVEAPYQAFERAIIAPGRYALALATRADRSPSFEIWNLDGTYKRSVDVADFTPTGILLADFPVGDALDAAGFSIGTLRDTDELGNLSTEEFHAGFNLALIGSELVAWQTVIDPEDGTLAISNILRGVFDTIPEDHFAGDVVWFISAGTVSTKDTPEPTDSTVTSKFLPQNTLGTLPIASAGALTLAFSSRYLRPYPPGNFRVGVLAWGVRPLTVAGDLMLSWNSRNRVGQVGVVAQDAGDFAPEPDTTYKIKLFIDGVLIRTVTTADQSFVYTAVERGTDDADFTKTTRVEVFANANGLDSLFPQVIETKMVGGSGILGVGRYEFGATKVGGVAL